MPLLDHRRLQGHRAKRLAHLQLCCIASGYIWQEGDAGAAKVLPACLSVPWCAVSGDLGLQPVPLHASIVLANSKWDPGTRSFRCLYPLPGGSDAESFVTVTADAELAFAKGLKNLMDALYHAEQKQVDQLTDCLYKICDTLTNIKQAVSKLHEEVSATVFYDVLRPFLTGAGLSIQKSQYPAGNSHYGDLIEESIQDYSPSTADSSGIAVNRLQSRPRNSLVMAPRWFLWGGENSPLPDGIIYEGVTTEPTKMTGGSAAQSSTIQCIDAVLGIQHKPTVRSFLENMRHYMPPCHREFLETIEKHSLVRETVHTSRNEKLTDAYNKSIQAVVDFRSYHIRIVAKYVCIMSHRDSRNRNYETLASQGTGGSDLFPFLKTLRSTTIEALQPTTASYQRTPTSFSNKKL